MSGRCKYNISEVSDRVSMVTSVGKQISQQERVCRETKDHSDPFGLDGLKQHLLSPRLSGMLVVSKVTIVGRQISGIKHVA